jgi:uracil phosphoribosyltransferase
MLATGQSIVAVYKIDGERDAKEFIAVVIAAPEGIAYLKQHLPEHPSLGSFAR